MFKEESYEALDARIPFVDLSENVEENEKSKEAKNFLALDCEMVNLSIIIIRMNYF